MAQASRRKNTVTALSVLEDQLRETYGRIVYTHKTHEVCADALLKTHGQIKIGQIVLSAITTAGFIGVIFIDERIIAVLGVIAATALLVVNAYTKDFDLSAKAQKHRQSASDIWHIRERYLSLLTDMNIAGTSIDGIKKRRDKLQDELHVVYKNAPSTNSKSYKKAQKKLQINEDMTFTSGEIDKFLPDSLKRDSKPDGA